MKTLTKRVSYRIDARKLDKYILNSLFNDDEANASDSELINYIFERYDSEYSVMRLNGEPLALNLSEWLSGLPSCIDVFFSYYDIRNYLKSIELDFIEDYTEEEQHEILNDWFYMVARSLMRLKEAI